MNLLHRRNHFRNGRTLGYSSETASPGPMEACHLPESSAIYYAAAWTVGSVIYSDAAMATPAADGYYSDGTNYFFQYGGNIDAVATCASLAKELAYSFDLNMGVCGASRTTYYCLDLGQSVPIYDDASGQTVSADGHYSDGTYRYLLQSGVIQTGSTDSCASQAARSLSYDASSDSNACAAGSPSTYYCNNLYTAGIIYDDEWGDTVAADGYYSDGVNWWQQSGGAITAEGSCA